MRTISSKPGSKGRVVFAMAWLRAAWIIGLIPNLASAQSHTGLALPSDSLLQVVKVCEQMQSLAAVSFPCLKVVRADASHGGFAIVPSPGEADILLVPLKKLLGIESPELLTEGSANWWQLAWDVRDLLIERSPRQISRDDIGLAVNSREARSQDQLHIHIACIDPGMRSKIAPFERAITRTWSSFPIRLASRSWWAMRLEEDDLRSNPFRLLKELRSAAGGSMGDWGVAVLAWTFADGSDGFLVFAMRGSAVGGQKTSGAALLDARCDR